MAQARPGGTTSDAVRPAGPVYSNESELRRKSIELLDFPAIREKVADFTRFLSARQLALDIEPSFDADEVDDLQRETAEGVFLLSEVGDVDLHASKDTSTSVDRASLGGLLTGMELLAVDASLDVQRRARSAFSTVRDSVPTLAGITASIGDLREVQGRIRSSIGSRGEVLDAAAPGLSDLRARVRDAYQDITDALEKVMQSPIGQEALQDQVISVRGERLVVQVKTDHRHRIAGIVHDASNTGATLFVEPFATVDLCNTWRELALEEEWMVRRVLLEMSGIVGAVAEDIRRGNEMTARLDFILARARYSSQLGGVPATQEEAARPLIQLNEARHPLLDADAVPITAQIDREQPVLVITGPNTGGKTVGMKTVGLLALMHQSGLRIPARDGTVLPVFDGIYADVGDQQSIQGSVSTFGSHIRNVIDILNHATADSLVLLDELGTSTDPEEGSALAKAILGHLASHGVTTIATTHHRTVAAFAEATEGMTNASVDLDADTLQPTYHLTLGVPGRSYAMSVAAQLGVPEEIMAEAQSLLEPNYRRFEDWLGELQNERDRLKQKIEEAETAERQADSARREAEAEREELAARRAEILHQIRGELEAEYENARRRLRRAESSLSWHVSPELVEEAGSEIVAAKAQIEAAEQRVLLPPPPRPHDERIEVGDIVMVGGLNARGKVLAIPEEGDEVDVAIGSVRFRLDIQRLTRAPEEEEDEKPQLSADRDVSYKLGPILPAAELHIRGMRAEDAMIKVEEFLDQALRDGLSSVRIIHGKGTGVLRHAVGELLDSHTLVKSYATEERERGGTGATVVKLL